MSAERLPFDELFLKEKLKSDPTTWETRRQLAHGLYDKQAYEEAAEIIWTTDQIPSTDLDLAFAIRILAKAQPRRAIRLLTAILELNQGKAVQNMAMANALLHHGMVLQAARFYGAALEADPTLVNPDLEHFVLWSDDECTMWDLFDKNRPKLGQLPWMLRDPKEALRLTSRISLHTTPIYVPELPKVHGEDLKHDLYQQEAKHQAKITPPPAVTIPIDRVDPKDRLYDDTYGATVVNSSPAAAEPDEPAAVEPDELAAVEPDELAAVEESFVPETADEPVAPAAPVAAVEVAAPVAPIVPVVPAEPSSSFPSKVVFPDSSRPAAAVAPAAPVIPAFTPAPIAAQAPSPFFADSTPPPVETPPPGVMPFFADSLPPIGGSVQKAVSFLGDERLTGPVQLPPFAPATPSPQLRTENHDSKPPEPEKEETRIPDALPISQSSVPTTLLHVKWSTAPARPGGGPATPPVAAPIPVLAPVPPGAPAALPFADAPPMPTPMPAAALMPTALPPYSQEEAAESGAAPAYTPVGIPTGPPTRPLIPIGPPATGGVPIPTGAPTRALLPSGTPPPNPTGAPTRALLPSGTPPPNPTGAPTRVLLPSGAPPANAAGVPTRRLLFTPPPQAQPPAGSDGQ